jgi:hypothetical protein
MGSFRGTDPLKPKLSAEVIPELLRYLRHYPSYSMIPMICPSVLPILCCGVSGKIGIVWKPVSQTVFVFALLSPHYRECIGHILYLFWGKIKGV